MHMYTMFKNVRVCGIIPLKKKLPLHVSFSTCMVPDINRINPLSKFL